MTREQFKEHVKACAEAKLSELYYAYRDALIAHDAAQRETITRLEGEVKRYELGEVVVANRIRELQARLTASEAREKECQQTYMRVIKALEVLNDRPAVRPLTSWDQITWLIDKLTASEERIHSITESVLITPEKEKEEGGI